VKFAMLSIECLVCHVCPGQVYRLIVLQQQYCLSGRMSEAMTDLSKGNIF
jgi:hypothetical protein